MWECECGMFLRLSPSQTLLDMQQNNNLNVHISDVLSGASEFLTVGALTDRGGPVDDKFSIYYSTVTQGPL